MRALALGLILFIAAPCFARDLPVPPAKGWQHAATGLILPATLAGKSRTALTDSGTNELDVAAQFGSGDGDESITIYLFHPGLDDVAVWFDRVDTAVHERDIYGSVVPTTAAPVAFSRPGSSISDSLKLIYTPGHGPYRSTAAAMMPLGDWIVSVRVSSKIDDPAALAGQLDAVIGEIRFPAAAPASRVVVPIADCTTHVDFHHAKVMKPDVAQVLLGALAGSIAHDDKDAASRSPVPFCRDGKGKTLFGIYRQDDGAQQYWMAFNDAGQAAYVSSGLSGLLGKGGYQVTLLTFDGSSVYPSFDKLPEPKQVLDLISGTGSLSHTSGKNVNITTKALST